jgi:hypothetical protein
MSGVPLAVRQCNSYITLQSKKLVDFQIKKLVDFQIKSFANIHKIPVFILFNSLKKHLGWNQVTTDPAVQDATVVTHTEYRTVSNDNERLFLRPQNYRNEEEKTNKIKE